MYKSEKRKKELKRIKKQEEKRQKRQKVDEAPSTGPEIIEPMDAQPEPSEDAPEVTGENEDAETEAE
jgi:hypothetical protein